MQSAIIILSDGDAKAGSSNFTSASLSQQPSLDVNECHAAISAAYTAAHTPIPPSGLTTWVYSIAYGASTSTSSSCQTDTPAISGCTTMASLASDPSKFYSDNANGCASTANPSVTSLSAIFTNISNTLGTTRLIPWTTN